jgi:hypothetical protein
MSTAKLAKAGRVCDLSRPPLTPGFARQPTQKGGRESEQQRAIRFSASLWRWMPQPQRAAGRYRAMSATLMKSLTTRENRHA